MAGTTKVGGRDGRGGSRVAETENSGIQTKLARKQLLAAAAFFLAMEIDEDLGVMDVDMDNAMEVLDAAVLEYAAQIGTEGEG